MLSVLQKKYLRVGLVSTFIATGLFVVSFPVWERYLTEIGYYTLASVATILCVAGIILHQYGKNATAPIFLIPGFAYYAVIKLASAIEKLISSVPSVLQPTSHVLIPNILEMMNLGAVTLVAIMVHQRDAVPDGLRKPALLLLLFLCPLSISMAFHIIILMGLPLVAINNLGVVMGSTSVILLLSVGYLAFHDKKLFRLCGPTRIPIAFCFLALSNIPSMIALFLPSLIWTMTIIMQLVAFANIYLSVAPTFLGKFGVHKKPAQQISLIVMILTSAPFFVTLLSEIIFPDFRLVNYGAYTVSTLGSSFMSAAFVIIICTYARKTGNMYQYPITFVFFLLTIVGPMNLILSPHAPYIQAESIAALIVTSLVSIPAFVQSIRWIDRKPQGKDERRSNRWIALGFIGIASLVITVEILQFLVHSYFPSIVDNLTGGPILLSLNALVSGEFVFLAFLVVAKTRGKINVESLSVGFLSLWILRNLLKSVFAEWTVGWWAGEFMLLIGLLLGPAFMGYLYMVEYLRAEESATSAKVYADVLAHDISNHHQVILYAIDIALLDVTPENMRKRALEDAYAALENADNLAKNVRRLGQIETMESEILHPMNIVKTINESFSRVAQTMRATDFSISLVSPADEPLIAANEFLHDIFMNLFRNVIEHTETNQVDVVVTARRKREVDYWEIRVIDHGQGIPYERRELLFERYMKGAKGSGLGLSVVKALTDMFGGYARIEDRVEGDHSKGSAFVLTFPAYKPENMV